MKDVQNSADNRGIDIQKVGVNNVHLPILLKMKNGEFQTVLATIKLTVDLPQELKGTHMSRFIEVLSEWRSKPVSSKEMCQILTDIIDRLEAQSAHLELRFKYFIEKAAPVSGYKSLLDVDCVFSGNIERNADYQFTMGVNVPFTSLCPCSKEISDYGAHNQRGEMRVALRCVQGQFVWIEDLVDLMEQQGSCPVYPLLKRADEKYVTEKAYDNPKFVEDVLRDLVISLRKLAGAEWFSVECENYESIHNHNAYAAHVETVAADC